MADRLYFLAYATTDLEGRSSRGLAEMTALSSLGGIKEKPRLPTNSCSNEVITAYQYPCMVGVQMPYLCNCIKMLALELKGSMSQEWLNRSRRLHKGRKIIRNILI